MEKQVFYHTALPISEMPILSSSRRTILKRVIPYSPGLGPFHREKADRRGQRQEAARRSGLFVSIVLPLGSQTGTF
jgi:hypothetical protein